jgi:uncharacterized membrane protein YidH (DUF202 family)
VSDSRPGGGPPGTQAERTRLAWRRTMLAVTAVALLAVRLAVVDAPAVGLTLAAAALLGWLGVLVVTYRRIGRMAAARPGPPGRELPLTAASAVGYAALGILLVLAAR